MFLRKVWNEIFGVEPSRRLSFHSQSVDRCANSSWIVGAGLVLSEEEYLYSSAKNYAGQKDYLLEVLYLE
jgi:hypothetical protein